MLGGGALLAALGFTPKRSDHCVRWAAALPDALIPTEANGGIAPADHDSARGPIICRAAAARAAGTCNVSAPIGEASSHLELGVLSVDGACVPLSEPMPSDSQDGARVLGTVRPHGMVEYMTVDPTCDVWWREVSEDVIPPIPELVRTLGATASGAKLALCRTFGDGNFGDGGIMRPGTLVVEGADFGKCFFTRADGSTGVIDGGRFHVLQVPL